MVLAAELVERFRTDLDPLIAADVPIGIAVSGGPDSLASLLLATAARPGLVEAATVDHALREKSREEADFVASICERLGVPHQTLTVQWVRKPTTAIQERARAERYGLLTSWAKERGLRALVTGHHLDDQAETLLMRLSRGAGVRGLAGVRRVSPAPGSDLRVLRPLLGWRRSELEQVCAAAGITPVADPTNADEQFERVRVRKVLARLKELDPVALARTAAFLADADSALNWSAGHVWRRSVTAQSGEILFVPAEVPREIRRRIVRRAVLELRTEGDDELRGRELDRLLETLATGGQATLRGVLCAGGERWRFIPAPNRTRRGRRAR